MERLALLFAKQAPHLNLMSMTPCDWRGCIYSIGQFAHHHYKSNLDKHGYFEDKCGFMAEESGYNVEGMHN